MFNFDPNDPRQMGLLMAAAQMFAPGPGGVGGALSRAIPQGLMGYQGAQGLKDRRAEEEQQRRMREMAIQDAQQQRAQQGQVRSLAQSAFGPNPNLVQNDDMGNAMPQAPGGGGMAEFSKGLMGIDPMLAIQMMPKPRAPMVLSKGARAFDESGREIAANPEPEKPMTREVKSGNKIFTYERQGGEWKKIAEAPLHKPDGPEKPARPQLYDGPEGPVWVTPPSAQAAGTQPVTDPQGNPISAKKRNQPLTESQAKATLFLGQMREAEKSISALKDFDPTTNMSQMDFAAAQKAKEAGTIPGALLNMYAGKNAQKYSQAAEQWSESFLRIKTGAAATRDEVLRNVRTFFPQPGEDAETIAQKNQARAIATKQMELIAGGGVQQLDAQSEPTKEPTRIRKYNPKTGRIE